MKVRIGIGAAVSSAGALEEVSGEIVRLGFDSLWVADVLTRDGLEVFSALTWAAARFPALKIGTTMLLPGRNVVRLATQLASLDSLSGGRLLVTFVPGLTEGAERDAIGVAVSRRREAMAEAMPLLRRLLAGEVVSHAGALGRFEDVVISPLAVQEPFEFWLGGIAPRSLELCGQLADGWLPALCSPAQAGAGRLAVEAAATRVGRVISPEHFGVSIGYCHVPLDDEASARLAERARTDDVGEIVPIGPEALRALIARFVDEGFSKFVLRPLETPRSWSAELEALADAVVDLQT